VPVADPSRLGAWDPATGVLNVIIETPKGSRNKLKYDPEHGLFQLSKVLPRGMAFPFDFGFIPSTVGEDGDPLDVLLLLDEPVPAGCRVPARLIGVIEAEQSKGEKSERNDRLIAVAQDGRDHKDIHSVNDLPASLLAEIEHFFVSYNEMDGKRFKPLGRRGPRKAEKLVREAAKGSQRAEANGRAEGAARK
jgi:inorganic pyrophosphatase